VRGRCSGETRPVGSVKVFDKVGGFVAWQSTAGLKQPDWRLRILWEEAAFSESKVWTLRITITITITHERRLL
jgi:hypothetical protein